MASDRTCLRLSRLRSPGLHAGWARWTAGPTLTLRWCAALATVVALLGYSGEASAKAFDIADTTWEGCSELYDLLQAELGSSRVKAVGVLDWSTLRPDDGVLVLHPAHALDADESHEFMVQGGRLAILDDFGEGDEVLRRFKIQRISAPAQPIRALRNNPHLAIAEPVLDQVAGRSLGPHPVVADVRQLVTNHPTGLTHPDLSPVLQIRSSGGPDVIVAVAGQVEDGRLFAMSDPSAVINLMLRYPGNRTFAQGLANYLVAEGDSGRRRGRLFIVANEFEETGTFGGKRTLAKDLENQLEELLRALEEARNDGLRPWMLLLLAAIAAFIAARWVVRSSAKPYKSPSPRYARPLPLDKQGGVAGRFALLAARSAPRSLALMELKSAAIEALGERLSLPENASTDAVLKEIRRAGFLDGATFEQFQSVISAMRRAEASVVAGRPAQIPRAALKHAADVVARVLEAVEHAPPAPAAPPTSTTTEGA